MCRHGEAEACCDKEFSVLIEIVRPCVAIEFLCRGKAWAGMAEARGVRAPWAYDRVRDHEHAIDLP